MKLKHRKTQEKRHREPDIPVGSFSDIAFLLIIFFLVATTLVKIKSIAADMPTGEKQSQAQLDKTPIVNLRDTQVFFNDRPVTIQGLGDRLAALNLLNEPEDKRVIMLESTSTTQYSLYYQALATISANHGVVALVEEEEGS